MCKPPGYISPQFPDHVCFLRKDLYGLKQTPRARYWCFAIFLSSIGFHSSKSDSSLFTFHRGKDVNYLLLYVDVIILTASSSALITKVIIRLSSKFPMNDLGRLKLHG